MNLPTRHFEQFKISDVCAGGRGFFIELRMGAWHVLDVSSKQAAAVLTTQTSESLMPVPRLRPSKRKTLRVQHPAYISSSSFSSSSGESQIRSELKLAF